MEVRHPASRVLGGDCDRGSTQAGRLSATTCGHPLIVEAALKNRASSFVIDGEAMLLGIDGVSDFNGLHSRKHDDAVQFYAVDILTSDGEDVRKLPLSMQGQPLPAAGAAHRSVANI
jgi:hypothetical protein